MIAHLILHAIIIHLLHSFNNNMQILTHVALHACNHAFFFFFFCYNVYITLETQQYGYTM